MSNNSGMHRTRSVEVLWKATFFMLAKRGSTVTRDACHHPHRDMSVPPLKMTARQRPSVIAKRKRRDEIALLFDLITQALKREGTDLPPRVLRKLRAELLTSESEENTIAAKEFSLELAIQTFGLEYATWGLASLWKIDDVPETKTFSPRPSLGTVPCILDPSLMLSCHAVRADSCIVCQNCGSFKRGGL